VGDVANNALFAQRYGCETCGGYYLMTATERQFSGIVTARMGKTAREGGS
jgi:hypothetical protein